MSVFSKIKSFFTNFFHKFISTQPEVVTILTDVKKGLMITAPIVETISTVAEGAVFGAEVTAIITVVQVDLTTAIKIATDLEKVTTLKELVDTMLSDLSSILSLTSIKNSSEVAEIIAYVMSAVQSIELVQQKLKTV
jgi:hypothetical protein